jgi:hypothetical protein
MKLASALLLGAAGFGIFRLLDRDLGEALEHFASWRHLELYEVARKPSALRVAVLLANLAYLIAKLIQDHPARAVRAVVTAMKGDPDDLSTAPR